MWVSNRVACGPARPGGPGWALLTSGARPAGGGGSGERSQPCRHCPRNCTSHPFAMAAPERCKVVVRRLPPSLQVWSRTTGWWQSDGSQQVDRHLIACLQAPEVQAGRPTSPLPLPRPCRRRRTPSRRFWASGSSAPTGSATCRGRPGDRRRRRTTAAAAAAGSATRCVPTSPSHTPLPRSAKELLHSRAYLRFHEAADVPRFTAAWDGHAFVSERGTQFRWVRPGAGGSADGGQGGGAELGELSPAGKQPPHFSLPFLCLPAYLPRPASLHPRCRPPCCACCTPQVPGGVRSLPEGAAPAREARPKGGLH